MPDNCYHCFREKSSYGPCPFCGYDPSGNAEKYPLALMPGSILNGRYIVGRVLGQGGFGITYIAQDYDSKARVAIKEFLPTDFAGRDRGSSSVQIYSGERKDDFEYGKAQFLEEAKTLAAFNGDEHIVRIYSYFEENNTAYFVMEYVEGSALDKYMKQNGGPLSVDESYRLLLPVMESLEKVHAKGIVHRDVAPDNIIVTKEGTAKLIDFGAARYSTGEKSKSLDVILKHGFAPKEQYTRRGRQGPFTDVYAFAATWYFAITGKIPPDAIDRIEEDELVLPSKLGIALPAKAEEALLRAMEVSAQKRYQNMTEFRSALEEAARGEKERREKEAREEADRLERERKALEAKAKEEQRKKEREEQKARKEAARQEKQRLEKEKREEEKRRAAERKKDKERKKTENPPGRKNTALIVTALLIAAVIGITAVTGVLRPKQGADQPQATAVNTESPVTPAISEEPDNKETELTEEQVSAGDEQKEASPEPEKEQTAEPSDQTSVLSESDYEGLSLQGVKTPGSIITFGSYEQDNNLENGKEEIEWIVLDVKNGKSLLISKYALDFQAYNNDGNTTWEACSLRKWLNESFLNEAFSQEEQLRIPTVTISADRNPKYDTDPGSATRDKVFLLSIPEAEAYFDSNKTRQCNPTKYAKAHSNISEDAACWWWLRSPGLNSFYASYVGKVGSVHEFGNYVYFDHYAVRPAIWIDISGRSDIPFESAEETPEAEDKSVLGDIQTVGSIVTFGSYEQDNDLTNGKEPIEWIVLDVKDGKSLLISKYALDCQQYNTSYYVMTWETCPLRKWLNGTFISSAFSSDEQNMIQITTVTADKNPSYSTLPGNNTTDKIFLLSITEVNKYFSSNEARKCAPTDYATEQGAWTSVLYETDGRATCYWWLRSPGIEAYNAACVYNDGSVNTIGSKVNYNRYAVRPALWINLGSYYSNLESYTAP